jgi:hypothetical protein
MELKSKHDSIIELANKLFVYTDFQYWDRLIGEVFKEQVRFDMSAVGAGPVKVLASTEICNTWKAGFVGIDHIHHHAGNFIVDFKGETEADIFCYATATHYKESATKGKTREFVGSYDLHAVLTDLGWRLDGFRYNLKYMNGNKDLA